MMTAVFMCQPLGQLAATLVALVAVVRQRGTIPANATVDNCTGGCLKTLDSVWRWIIGVGVIPAVVALWFRLTIIESPRYTADVGGDSRKAASELNRYLPTGSSSSTDISLEIVTLNQRTNFITSEDGTILHDPSGENSQTPLGFDNDLEGSVLEDADENKPPPEPSWRDFKDYFWYQGNSRTLLAVSLCWFFVDL
jgi:MFS transporter, PHS family, inorganic phosphate transporter